MAIFYFSSFRETLSSDLMSLVLAVGVLRLVMEVSLALWLIIIVMIVLRRPL